MRCRIIFKCPSIQQVSHVNIATIPVYGFCMHCSIKINAAAAGPTEEEYVLLADYVTDIEGELSVSAGDVVQLINREATGIAI